MQNSKMLHLIILCDYFLDIGGKIVAENEEKNEAFKKQSLQRREEEVWQKAEQYKNQCVQEAVNEANLKAAKAMQKMQDVHEKNLSKEISRVEGIYIVCCALLVMRENTIFNGYACHSGFDITDNQHW